MYESECDDNETFSTWHHWLLWVSFDGKHIIRFIVCYIPIISYDIYMVLLMKCSVVKRTTWNNSSGSKELHNHIFVLWVSFLSQFTEGHIFFENIIFTAYSKIIAWLCEKIYVNYNYRSIKLLLWKWQWSHLSFMEL